MSIAALVQPVNADISDPFEISYLPFTISESGNYYLTQNLTCTALSDAITIQTDNVTINGGGYSITIDDENSNGLYANGYSNIQIVNLCIIGGEDAFHFDTCTDLWINGCYVNSVYDDGFDINGCYNCSISYCYVNLCGDRGFQIKNSEYFQIDSCSATWAEYTGIAIGDCIDFTIQSTNVQNNGYGVDIYRSMDASIYDCTIDSNFHTAGFVIQYSERIYVDYCAFTNQTQIGAIARASTNCEFYGCTFETSGSCGLTIEESDLYVANNVFYNNGVDVDNYYGVNCGLAIAFANCTVTDNLFENNTNAIYWFANTAIGGDVDESTVVSATQVRENVFQSNNNTLLLDYEYPTFYSNQSFIFTNNLVNDTAYINPAGLQMATENVPINGTVLSFNGTVECGHKIYGAGPFVGGNYWAYPNGTGLSQIGTDANRDGFIDTPLELLGNATVGAAYDFHPYSDDFDTNQWINITLPAEIYSPGHYRIMNSWNGTDIGLLVFANDVVVDGRNCSIQTGLTEGFNPSVLLEGNNIRLENLTIQNSYAGLLMVGSNSTVRNVSTNNTLIASYMFMSQNVTFSNINVNNTVIGLYFGLSVNFTISNCTINSPYLEYEEYYGQYGGLYGIISDTFTIENVSVNGSAFSSGFSSVQCSNFQVKSCNFTNNSQDGFTGQANSNFTITNSILNNNGWGAELTNCHNATFQNCQLSDNSQALYAGLSNVTFIGNTVSYNDKEGIAYRGGIESANSNLTAISNIFDSNFDAIMWKTSLPINTTTIIQNNIFRNNNYTFFIYNQLPNTLTPQKLLFFNNLINDSAYIDPTCLNTTYSGNYLPFNATAFDFNTTLQTGSRIYGVGTRIGGNFWAYPNGTGPSQTGADANHDGFIDTPFNLFGNATIGTVFDFLPLSAGYTSSLSFTGGAGQSIGPNQLSDAITVTRTDYFGSVPGVIINLASSSIAGTFYSDAAGTKQVTSITMASNQTTATFYYRDSIQGTPVITAMSQNANQAQTTFTIKYTGSSSFSGSTTTTTSPTVTPTPTPTPTVTPTPTPTPETIQATKDDSSKATITINSGNIAASQYSNATLTTNQTASTTILSFTVTGETGTTGFCNLTITKSEIHYGTTPVVYIDGVLAENQGYTQDANNYYVWYTTHFSTHQISVQFSGVKNTTSETPVWTYAAVIVVVLAIIIVAAVMVSKRKHK